jgi:D-psicose/D-tagatose/L-ribulose 3-epimerase
VKLGIHAYAWCSQWSNETLDLIDRVKGLGLDFIEIPLMCLEACDPNAIKGRLQSIGLDVCTSTVLLGETDITSDDPAIRHKGVAYLKRCVRTTNFSGVIYSQHVKPTLRRPTEQTWPHAAESLRSVAKFAQTLGVNINRDKQIVRDESAGQEIRPCEPC